MNRKQRRAALKQSSSGTPAGRAADNTELLLTEAHRYQQQNRLEDAAQAYKRLLLVKPDDAEAHNGLACALQAQGKPHDASAHFARALELTPQLFAQFGAICATLCAILPPLGDAMRRVNEAWPRRLSLGQLFTGDTLSSTAADPLLLTILQSTPVRDVKFERVLTVLRAALLDNAATDAPIDDTTLALICALAQQCFINEYVFDVTPIESERVEQLKSTWPDSARVGEKISPQRLAAIAMYSPLYALPEAQALLDARWPSPVDALLTQQFREPMQERALRDSIPRLTAIDNSVSVRVREQYEENPYPRWVHSGGFVEPVSIDGYLRAIIPNAAFAPLDKQAVDVLVAGCGTGSHPIEIAKKLQGARILAVDLSLSSLAYARRKTPADLAARIDYGQADILKLGMVGRDFDIVDASGVLHHMADPAQGLRMLVSLVRPGGFMHLGLYSELARRDVTAARKYAADKGYRATTEDIRRCRQDLLDSNLRNVAQVGDFYSTSECRDLLFHAQEHRLTIPEIESLLSIAGLTFIGFAFDPPRARYYAALFEKAGKSTRDFAAWHEFEVRNPETFSGMYQFWVQKSGT